jgi:hypothetical protein
MKTTLFAFAAIALLVLTAQPGEAQRGQAAEQPMSFFITSTGSGNGADLGGLAGADAHCQSLAEAAGSDKTWHAYLSTSGAGGVNARDRIGAGPWYNSNNEMIARNVADLHGDVQRDRNNLHKGTALSETGATINGRGDQPNRHDMLTGSNSDGRASDMTCNNWTNSGEGSALLGHHDRNGGGNTSWNSAHGSRGCGQEALVGTGGAGLFYCFAID